MSARPIPHGTPSGYNHHRCRCQDCREAKNTLSRERGYNRHVGRRKAAKERWEEAARHVCANPSCDALVDRRVTRCRDCEDARRQGRRRQIQGLWHDGLTLKQIADEVGTSVGAIQVTIVYMRQAGWDMPYRYAWKRLAA